VDWQAEQEHRVQAALLAAAAPGTLAILPDFAKLWFKLCKPMGKVTGFRSNERQFYALNNIFIICGLKHNLAGFKA
jgi:hypothetical protein